MKKIVVCIALAIISMMSAAASFLVNDAPAYRNWAQVNRPKIMETFGRDKKEKPGKMPPPAARPRKEEQRAPMMNPSHPKWKTKTITRVRATKQARRQLRRKREISD